MTQFRLDEAYLDAVVVQLRAHLPAAITEVDVDRADGILIGTPEILDFVPTPKALNFFPTVGVRTGRGRLTDDTGGGGTWEQEIIIVCFVQDAEQRNLGRRLMRLSEAVANTAYPRERSYPDPGSIIWGMRSLEVEPGPTLERNEAPRDWMSYSAVSFQVRGEADQFP